MATPGANATEVTAISGGTNYSFPAVTYEGNGPQTVAPGITWSSNSSQTVVGQPVFGFTSQYGFGLNGWWDGALGPMAGLNCFLSACGAANDSMIFALASPVSAIGGFINFAPEVDNATIAVFDSSNTLIEQATVSFVKPGPLLGPNFYNFGEFLGFQEASNDISYFTLSDAYVGIAGLTTLTTTDGNGGGPSVPEPATLGLFAIGFAGVYRMQKRKPH
jgi:hypothetical protein